MAIRKQKEDKTVLFESMPIRRAVASLAIPTVISQLVTVIYNMADTWFIGLTGDPAQVAAVTVAYPIYMLMNAIANLFGIGGSSLFSRLLGTGDKENSGKVAAYAIWMGGIVALIYSILILLFGRQWIIRLGAKGSIASFAQEYLFWTAGIGALPTVLNLILGNIVRGQGEAKAASFGMLIGSVLNVILDPIFIFGFHMNVAGAALATTLSNTIGLLYLVYHMVKNRKTSIVQIPLFPSQISQKNMHSFYAIGLPAALQIALSSISNSMMVKLMSGYLDAAVSGMGIMQKVEIIPFQIVMGISTGVLPLIAYNYASGNHKRMQEGIHTALKAGLITSIVFFVSFEWFAPQIVQFFINDPKTIHYGAIFTRERLLALPFITLEFMLIAVFQATGSGRQAFILSIFRKGIVDLPLMMIMNQIYPMYGLMLVQPIMEFSGAVIAIDMYQSMHNHKMGQNPIMSMNG